MSEEKHENTEELDCTVTVKDGSYMTCDMIEDESAEKEETPAELEDSSPPTGAR